MSVYWAFRADNQQVGLGLEGVFFKVHRYKYYAAKHQEAIPGIHPKKGTNETGFESLSSLI